MFLNSLTRYDYNTAAGPVDVVGCLPQVLALVAAPFLLDHPNVSELFPSDAIARAKKLLEMFKGGIGAYCDSKGSLGVRKEVAEFIKNRDGFPSDPEVQIKNLLLFFLVSEKKRITLCKWYHHFSTLGHKIGCWFSQKCNLNKEVFH